MLFRSPRQPRAHVVVFGNVLGVVEIDKLKVPDLAVHGQRDDRQHHADPHFALPPRHSRRCRVRTCVCVFQGDTVILPSYDTSLNSSPPAKSSPRPQPSRAGASAAFSSLPVLVLVHSLSPLLRASAVKSFLRAGALTRSHQRWDRKYVTLVLASQSPRRAEILRQAGIPFTVRVAPVDETPLPAEPPVRYVERLAEMKAAAVDAAPDEVALDAHTTVVIDGHMRSE